ncbi:MAG: hypothetical protein A3A33_01035 [Candidatus Yanofskybacteria bacterium RIFCSPLOWO2_01_FULL_49_25]|uniref:Ion transport domain-containing protein n=1 Tax=Candidatus Yanofskybacteria bacterium RIFCSPLOWO2_01_FULL_49_25 TaxID=1802701 RepID=A0A1F8GYZ7_9BACT|nr:MAG: hypothetical protein A3A33_01035 [Candidatus Yanofskybacteria bacterium RIFCSPLOWO2_01_FULL_49_25]
MTIREKIHNFFEAPDTIAAKAVQFVIVLLILFSVAFVVIEQWYGAYFLAHKSFFQITEHSILAAFTVEYILRLSTAPIKWKFAVKPLNLIDFVAVFPNYLEFLLPIFINTTELRVLRLIRLLRFSRILRAFKLFRYGEFFKRVLRYRGTILEAITPILLLVISIKGGVWILEHHDRWIQDPSLGDLFAIIGFALGIILSQKISSTYDKFLEVETTIVRLSSTLTSLGEILDRTPNRNGRKACQTWARDFLLLLKDPGANNHDIYRANMSLYQAIRSDENVPGDLHMTWLSITNDATFCLSKKARLTPRAYDLLLQQATVLYLVLIALFIPGLTGMISVFIAAYILYGMYYLTQDLDSIVGGEYQLINIDISELEQIASEPREDV